MATVPPVVVLYFLLGDAGAFAPDKSSDQTAVQNRSESALVGPSGTDALSARVVEVTDGDTLLVSGRTGTGVAQRVRLASIDAPERTMGPARPGQPFADASRQFLARCVQGRSFALVCYEQDPHGRHVCDVPDSDSPGATVSQALVEAGMTWANMEGNGRFLRDRSLTGLQAQAQSKKLGIWSGLEPVAP